MRIVSTLICFLILALSLPALSQTDNNVVKVDSGMMNPGTKSRTADSSNIKKPDKKTVFKDSARLALENMPRVALRRALIFPGLGQIYNKQLLKLPFVYGGFVGIGLVFEFNQRYYKEYLTELQYRLANGNIPLDPKLAPYENNGIISAKDYYRRNRDLSIIAGVAFYAFQAIDAYVKAKFARYDISTDLSLQVQPSLQTVPYVNASNSIPSLKITLSL